MLTLRHRKFLLAAKDDCETLYVEMECLENFIRDLTWIYLKFKLQYVINNH